jgi:Ca-activated chloride channel family protein
MYELENISWSWLFLLIILISILFIFDRAWKIKTQKLFFSKSNLERLSPNISNLKPIIKIFFMIIGTSMFILAMINPKIGTKIETFQRLGVDIVFAVDVSKSMLAEDIAPSRIEKSKQLVGQVINNLGGDRIGIVAYAGKAFPQLPLTTDYSSAKMFLQNMNTDMLSSQGTAIDEAIRLSSTYFDQDQSTERLLFVVSDGEDHNDLSYEMADLAAKNDITIYSVGVGTEKGSPIPIKKNGIVMSYKKDINGEVVITKLNKNYLENISDKTKGKYIDGSVTENVINQVIEILENTEKKEFDTQKFSEFKDQFQWFILIGFVLIVIDIFMRDGKTIWLKNLNLFNEK